MPGLPPEHGGSLIEVENGAGQVGQSSADLGDLAAATGIEALWGETGQSS